MKRKKLMLLLLSVVLLAGCSQKGTEIETTLITESETEIETESETEIEKETETKIETESATEVKLSKEQQYITDLFKKILGREVDEKALEYYEKILLDENKGVRQVILMLFQSEEFKNRKIDKKEFLEILFDTTFSKSNKEEKEELLKGLQEDYSDYINLLIQFLNSDEFRESIEAKRLPLGSLPTINNEVVILNNGVVVTTAEKYKENQSNIKFKHLVVETERKQNIIVVEEETEKETQNQEQGRPSAEPAQVPQPQTQAPQPQTQAPQPQTQAPQTQAPVWVVTKAAWEEVVPVYEWQLRAICACGFDMTVFTDNQIDDHLKAHVLAGDYHFGSWATQMVEIQVGTKTIHHPEEGYWK